MLYCLSRAEATRRGEELDEPTTGLDPQARAILWVHIGKLRAERGATVFLTLTGRSLRDAEAGLETEQPVLEGAEK